MPNPPTQGRKEAITKGAKALEDSRFFSATSWKAKEMFRELAQAVLDAAYPERPFPWQEAEGEPTEEEWKRVLKPGRYKPVEGVKRQKEGTKGDSASDTERYQQTEGDEREWRIEKQLSGVTIASPGLEEVHDPITVVPKSCLIAVEDEWRKIMEEERANLIAAERRAEKAERAHETVSEALVTLGNDLKKAERERDVHLQAVEDMAIRRDRLQRELDDARAQHLTLSNQALDATTKVDRLQREVERLTVWASHKREHIYKVEGERDRLQRECEKLREALGDIAESGKPLNWARDIARDALEKP